MAKSQSSDSQNVRTWNKKDMITSPPNTIATVLQDFQGRFIKCIFFHLYEDSVGPSQPVNLMHSVLQLIVSIT